MRLKMKLVDGVYAGWGGVNIITTASTTLGRRLYLEQILFECMYLFAGAHILFLKRIKRKVGEKIRGDTGKSREACVREKKKRSGDVTARYS